MLSKLATVFTLASLASAVPAPSLLVPGHTPAAVPRDVSTISKRFFACGSPVWGLNPHDCEHMSRIGIAGPGANARSNNGNMWLGDDGPNTFHFTNNAAVGLTLVVWNKGGDFVAAHAPAISYSIAPGQSVVVSLANEIQGGWTALYDGRTPLTQWGQILNTWGEFHTGQWATVDISREVHMHGNSMEISIPSTGCTATMDRCSYVCRYGAATCWQVGTYDLLDCAPGTQPGAAGDYESPDEPKGGCQGFANGGRVDIGFS